MEIVFFHTIFSISCAAKQIPMPQTESPSMNEIRRFIVHPFLSALVIAIVSLLTPVPVAVAQQYDTSLYSGLRWRLIGPFRGGRINAVSGVAGPPETPFLRLVGGGVLEDTRRVSPPYPPLRS